MLVINGQQASIPQNLWADFHGHSVFTTLRSYQGKPMLWARHWSRLVEHAQFFGYQVPHEQTILTLIEDHLKNLLCQKIRVIIKQRDYALTFEPYEPPSKLIYQGVQVITATIRPHPQLLAFKTGNYLPYSLALQEAKSQGAFEALMLNEHGHLVDGTRSSIMMYDGQTLTALMGGLMGCMREEVLALAEGLGIKTARRLVKPQEISGQLLLANSLLGVVPVGEIKHDVAKHLVDHFRMS